jgi:hypothetical protein
MISKAPIQVKSFLKVSNMKKAIKQMNPSTMSEATDATV